jgi:hypothetical protein
LFNKRVLVIGCGAVGSVVVEQLARAGLGGLTTLDKDYLEPGNLTRHAAEMAHTGLGKSVAAAQLAAAVNPFIEVDVAIYPIGQPILIDGQSVGEAVTQLMASADLVVDATAEPGVQRVTADLAREARVGWLAAAASEGAAGGSVVHIPADAQWCFACYQWHQADETIPFPVALETERVQPVGCSEPTFVGAGFDLAEVSLHAARVAVAAMLRSDPDGYPDDDYDAYVLTLRRPDGSRSLPRWDGYHVTRHPRCGGH